MVVKEKYVLRTVRKELLLFTRISYFPALILAFLLFVFVLRPGLSRYLFGQYEKNKDYESLYNAYLAEQFNDKYLFELGKYFEGINDSKAAIFYLESALKYDRHNETYYLHMARIYTRMHMYKEAYSYYNLVLKFNPYRAFSYNEFAGFCYACLNDEDLAKKYLKIAVELEPYYFTARHNIAVLYRKDKNYDAAIAEYDKIEKNMPSANPINPLEKELVSFTVGDLYVNKASLLKDMEKYSESCYYYGRYFELTKDKKIKAEMDAVCSMEKK